MLQDLVVGGGVYSNILISAHYWSIGCMALCELQSRWRGTKPTFHPMLSKDSSIDRRVSTS